MGQVPDTATGLPVYRACYGLADDGTWAIAVETDHGTLRTTAARLSDVERRAYELVRNDSGLDSRAFDVTFVHEIDLTGQPSPSKADS